MVYQVLVITLGIVALVVLGAPVETVPGTMSVVQLTPLMGSMKARTYTADRDHRRVGVRPGAGSASRCAAAAHAGFAAGAEALRCMGVSPALHGSYHLANRCAQDTALVRIRHVSGARLRAHLHDLPSFTGLIM